MAQASGPNVSVSARGRNLAQGPKGLNGDQGLPGDQGDPGPTGPAGAPSYTPLRKSASYAAQAGDSPLLYANTTSGAWTFTMPATPTDGQLQIINDEYLQFSTHNLTVLCAGGQSIIKPYPNAGISGSSATLAMIGGYAWRWSAATSTWITTGA